MRLYHPHRKRLGILSSILFIILITAGCSSPQATQAAMRVNLTADQETYSIQIPPGSTVQNALDEANISLDALDRTDPPIYTVLRDGAEVRIVRVREEFEVEEVVIPFEQQIVRNESLPVDNEILIQRGINGIQEITYRHVYEDGVEVTDKPIPVKAVIVKEPVPEIRMVGVQAPLAPVTITGELIYLRDGNVWRIVDSTGNREALMTTGDLDGRVFSVSSDGSWLLFTRQSGEEENINSLWAARIGEEQGGDAPEGESEIGEPIDLSVNNVVHFAEWYPGSNSKIIFSTVEPREAAPGWQANNDLNTLTFSTSGWTTNWSIHIEPNAGGIYGWWGSNFIWNPDGDNLAYARPDSIGLVDLAESTQSPLVELVPLLTRGDWAWVPGITWGPDGNVIYTVDHVSPPGSISPEESQLFDLTAIPIQAGPPLHLVSPTGMFAYPLASPMQTKETGEIDYQIAYLQAVFPQQSDTSRYYLTIMDRDGSNRREVFPNQDRPGLEPQQHWGAWSPGPMPESENYAIAIIYQGNLWLVDSSDSTSVQITGDGLTNRVIWRP
jgi:hypothetical protein